MAQGQPLLARYLQLVKQPVFRLRDVLLWKQGAAGHGVAAMESLLVHTNCV